MEDTNSEAKVAPALASADTLALELVDIRKVFGTFEALGGVSLTQRRGEVLGFLGPNGAGKTTTLRIATGVIRPTSGRATVCGFDVVKAPIEAKRRVGYISDQPFLYEKLTGAEFLRFVGGLFGMAAAEIEEQSHQWMRRFEMLGWMGESIESYSHGMRQRLLFAAALLHAPELLIMDEPTVGLDPRGAAQLKAVIRELASDHGIAVLLSTHTLDVVEQVCDTVAIIDRGRILASGTLAEVLEKHEAEPGRLEELFLRLTARPEEGAASAAETPGG